MSRNDSDSIATRARALARPPMRDGAQNADAQSLLRPLAPAFFAAQRPPAIAASFPRRAAWHVVMTGIKCEFRARLALGAKGFDVYLPVEKRIVRHARRKVVRLLPLFKRYLFVAFDIERDEWYAPIRATDGVADLLCYPRVVGEGRNADTHWIPLQVPDAQIAALRRKEAAGAFDYTKAGATFTPGDAVRVAQGALTGLEAIVHATPPNKRVELLLDMLGRKTLVKLDAGEIEKIDAS
ncbi:MAG: transcription termination/antitermination protein NusG [Pseudorhodoplanes sp.]